MVAFVTGILSVDVVDRLPAAFVFLEIGTGNDRHLRIRSDEVRRSGLIERRAFPG